MKNDRSKEQEDAGNGMEKRLETVRVAYRFFVYQKPPLLFQNSSFIIKGEVNK